jgi:hypothetical protein
MTILFILLFTVTVLIGTETAGASATISIEPLYKRVPAGGNCTLNITIDPGGNEVSGLQYKLYFNNTLEATAQTKGTFLSQDGLSTNVLLNEINNSIGLASYAEYRVGVDYGVTRSGIAAAINFEAVKSGASIIIPANVIISDPGAKPIPTIIQSGRVDVVSSTPYPFLVSGYVFYENGSECFNPTVCITNQNLSRVWTAEVNESSNYYECLLTSPLEVMNGDLLQFDALNHDKRYLNSSSHIVTIEEIENESLSLNLSLQKRIIRDVNVSLAYYPKGNGIRIVDEDGTNITQLELDTQYFILYEVLNEGEQDELVGVATEASNADWNSLIGTHDWFVAAGGFVLAPPPPIGDCLNTSGLAAGYYNISVKANIPKNHNPDFYPENNERIRPVPIGVTPTPSPTPTPTSSPTPTPTSSPTPTPTPTSSPTPTPVPTPPTVTKTLSVGWNLISTPKILANDSWCNISEWLDYCIAYRYDTNSAEWLQMKPDTELKPLEAIFVKMNSQDNITFVWTNETLTAPPARGLPQGWNLMGLNDLVSVKVDIALRSIEVDDEGLPGYSTVYSPVYNSEVWTYTIGEWPIPYMMPYNGYWVFMDHDDTLAGRII